MAVDDDVSAEELSHAFAAAVREESAAQRLWVSQRRGLTELWLLIAPTDTETERRLYGTVPALYDRFPSAHFDLHIFNPRHYPEVDPVTLIPQGAEEIPLRPE